MVISNCINCTNGSSCIDCRPGYTKMISPMNNQIICSDCNFLFDNCHLCNGSSCYQCYSPYVLGNSSNCDECESGYIKSDQYCFKYPGCLSTAIINGVEICLSCAT